jgi:hypothetical protein
MKIERLNLSIAKCENTYFGCLPHHPRLEVPFLFQFSRTENLQRDRPASKLEGTGEATQSILNQTPACHPAFWQGGTVGLGEEGRQPRVKERPRGGAYTGQL